VFYSGQDDTIENADPFTYKNRGAYFNGADNLITLDVSSRFYLHAIFSFDIWFYVDQDAVGNGSLFSKSHADWTSATSSAFFDLQVDATN